MPAEIHVVPLADTAVRYRTRFDENIGGHMAAESCWCGPKVERATGRMPVVIHWEFSN